MAANAFTSPRNPVFDTPAEQARLRMSAGGRKGGTVRHSEQGGTVNPNRIYRAPSKTNQAGNGGKEV